MPRLRVALTAFLITVAAFALPSSGDVMNLLGGGLTRDPLTSVSEAQIEASHRAEARLVAAPQTSRYDGLIARLKADAGISQRVPVRVLTDQMSQVEYTGGYTTLTTIFMDGKLLDILSEYANYRAGANSQISPAQAIDAIVASHNAVPGKSVEPQLFPRRLLTENQAAQADEFLADEASFLIYHEFGHLWRASIIQTFLVPEEEQSDIVAGFLLRKAGKRFDRAWEVLDIEAYAGMQRLGLARSVTQISGSFAAQIAKPTVMYGSQAMRKNYILSGQAAYGIALMKANGTLPIGR